MTRKKQATKGALPLSDRSDFTIWLYSKRRDLSMTRGEFFVQLEKTPGNKLSYSSYTKLERGLLKPTKAQIAVIVKTLGVAPDVLEEELSIKPVAPGAAERKALTHAARIMRLSLNEIAKRIRVLYRQSPYSQLRSRSLGTPNGLRGALLKDVWFTWLQFNLVAAAIGGNRSSMTSSWPEEIDGRKLGDAIRERRLELDLTQKTVAARIGYEQIAVSNIEVNRSVVQIPLDLLASALGWSINDLFEALDLNTRLSRPFDLAQLVEVRQAATSPQSRTYTGEDIRSTIEHYGFAPAALARVLNIEPEILNAWIVAGRYSILPANIASRLQAMAVPSPSA